MNWEAVITLVVLFAAAMLFAKLAYGPRPDKPGFDERIRRRAREVRERPDPEHDWFDA